MAVWTLSLSLQDDEDYGPNHRDEVERQIHQVSNDGIGCELLKGRHNQLTQPCYGVPSSFDLSPI